MSKTSTPDERFPKESPTESHHPIDGAEGEASAGKSRRRDIMPVHSVIAKLDRLAKKSRKGKGDS